MVNVSRLAWKGSKAFVRASARNNVFTAGYTKGGGAMQGDGSWDAWIAIFTLIWALVQDIIYWSGRFIKLVIRGCRWLGRKIVGARDRQQTRRQAKVTPEEAPPPELNTYSIEELRYLQQFTWGEWLRTGDEQDLILYNEVSDALDQQTGHNVIQLFS